jgi:hypothetical protein
VRKMFRRYKPTNSSAVTPLLVYRPLSQFDSHSLATNRSAALRVHFQVPMHELRGNLTGRGAVAASDETHSSLDACSAEILFVDGSIALEPWQFTGTLAVMERLSGSLGTWASPRECGRRAIGCELLLTVFHLKSEPTISAR